MTGSDSVSDSTFTETPPRHFLSYFMKELSALPTPGPVAGLGAARELINGTSDGI